MGNLEAAMVICAAITTAEVIYLDSYGNKLLTTYLGEVKPGGIITCKVPEPQDVDIKLI